MADKRTETKKKLMNIGEVAEFLNIPVATVRDYVWRKQIPYVKVGRHVRFRHEEILAWLESRSVPPENLVPPEKSWSKLRGNDDE